MKKALLYFMAALLVFGLISENLSGDTSWRRNPLLGEDGVYTKFVGGINGFGDKALEYVRLLLFGNEDVRVSVGNKTYYIPFTNVFLLEDFEDIVVITVGSSSEFNVAGGTPDDYVILYSSDSRFIFKEKYFYYYKFLKGMYLKDSNGNEHRVLSSTSISGSDYRCLSDLDYHLFYDYYSSLLQQ